MVAIEPISFYSSMTERGPMGEDSAISMRFNDIPISKRVFERFERACRENIEFGPINAEQLRDLMLSSHIHLTGGIDGRRGQSSTKATRNGLDIFQAQSIRRHVIRQYNMFNTHRVENEIGSIIKQYESGCSILDISAVVRLSPFIIFRKMMEQRGPEMHDKLKLLSLGKTRASDIFDERTAKEYEIVKEYDFESCAVQMQMAEMADKRELNFITFMRDGLGIALRTQSELYEEAMASGVHPITPDALFIDPVEINGVRVKWADFKSYCGTPISFLMRSTRQQYKKYCEAFGPGVIVYEHGFVESMPYFAVSARGLRSVIEDGLRRAVLI